MSQINNINRDHKYLIENVVIVIKDLDLTYSTIRELNIFALSSRYVDSDTCKIISQKIMNKIDISILNDIVKTGKDNVTYLALILRYVKAEDELKRIEIAKILLTNYIN